MSIISEIYCLGHSCRFYRESPDSICFKPGVLPHCSPELKKRRRLMDIHSVDMYETLQHTNIVLYNLGKLSQQQNLLQIEIDKILTKLRGGF